MRVTNHCVTLGESLPLSGPQLTQVQSRILGGPGPAHRPRCLAHPRLPELLSMVLAPRLSLPPSPSPPCFTSSLCLGTEFVLCKWAVILTINCDFLAFKACLCLTF